MVGAMDMQCAVLWVLAVAKLIQGQGHRDTVELETSLGRIRGYSEYVVGKQIESYLGIPFGKPPVDNLRFQRPQSAEPWDGTWDATNKPNSCPQVLDYSFDSFEGVTMWNANTNISEDCLYLNVWTPQRPSRSSSGRPRAVLIWIFGGGFYAGTSTLDLYDGRIMASEGDVVVVSMQYRSGAMGFLYLGTSGAPGNVGLLDQQLAMEWIFNNIHDYGGDNSRITIFGESSGAASVSFHMLSPLSKQTFHRAILQSSTALSPWAVDPTDVAKAKSLSLATKVGCTEETLEHILQCLRKVSFMDLTNQMWTLEDKSVLQTPLTATIDGYFLREHPIDILADQNFKLVPTIMGVNHDEGAYFLPWTLPKLYNMSENNINTQEKYLQGVRQILRNDDELTSQIVAYEYKHPYHYKKRISYPDMLDDILGDYCFICPVINYALSLATAGQPVYFYRFTHVSSHSPWPKWMGVLHGYEIDTVFGLALNDSLGYTMPEKDLAQRTIQLWTNFAKTGNPTQREGGGSMAMSWPPYSSESRQYVVLNTTSPAPLADGLRDRKCSFWRELIPKIRARNNRHNPGYTCGCSDSQYTITLLLIVLTCSIFPPNS